MTEECQVKENDRQFLKLRLRERTVGVDIDTTGTRSVFTNCTFADVRLSNVEICSPIFDRCTFRDCRTDYLFSNGSVFVECVCQGTLGGGFILLDADEAVWGVARPKESFLAVARENERLMRSARFSLDLRAVTDAGETSFNGDLLAGKMVFNPGEMALIRGSNMMTKLEPFEELCGKDEVAGLLVGGAGGCSFETCAVWLRPPYRKLRSEIEAAVTSVGLEVTFEPLVKP